MSIPDIRPASWPASPIRHSDPQGRPLRQDGLATLGTSTQTWAEVAIEEGCWDLALDLVAYFAREIAIMNDVLFVSHLPRSYQAAEGHRVRATAGLSRP